MLSFWFTFYESCSTRGFTHAVGMLIRGWKLGITNQTVNNISTLRKGGEEGKQLKIVQKVILDHRYYLEYYYIAFIA